MFCEFYLNIIMIVIITERNMLSECFQHKEREKSNLSSYRLTCYLESPSLKRKFGKLETIGHRITTMLKDFQNIYENF
jgi:hypothetical protein